MQNYFFYLIHKFWKFHWDQACMASATASKTLGGQTQNLRNIIDLVSWETKLKKGIVLVSEIIQMTSWFFRNADIKQENVLGREKIFKSQ